ncbi:MAG TPA: DUF2961 domain-containing protein [Kiritimatiellia bacterium]|nr:DUF2961 domain-containing protein [Kiritimatiellia bacterium]
MKLGLTILPLALLVLLLSVSCIEKTGHYVEKPGVSWASILRDALDLNSLTEPIASHDRSIHFSSAATTGRVILANLAPQIYGDMDHGFFLDVEENDSGVDATLAEISGTGMITWIWSANPTGTIRLFIDDRDKPVMETSFAGFIGGNFLPHRSPFSSLTAHGHNLHFPIIHTNYFKIQIRVPKKEDLGSLFYQIAWNALDSVETIHSFDADDIAKGKSLLKDFSKAIVGIQELPSLEPTNHIELRPNSSTPIFTSSDPGTISSIFLSASSRADLASLHFRAFWDDELEPALDCPLHLLAGVSSRMEDSLSLPVTTRGNKVELRWKMPYRYARIEVANLSTSSIYLKYNVSANSVSSPLRFKATLKRYPNLRTQDRNILSLSELTGTGRLVGCNIIVQTRTSKWWGEGDQLIYLDSISEPTWRGTGTEDYFGFAWCATSVFNHPFRGQTFVGTERDVTTTSLHRYHLLDRLPFHKFARFHTEAWGLAEGKMNYESLILYYLQ